MITLVAAAVALASAWRMRPSGAESQVAESVGGQHASGPVNFAALATVDPAAPFEGEVSRRVLALYDSDETVEEEDDHGNVTRRPIDPQVALAHRLAELPLNHLGLVLDYHDVNRGEFPDAAEMRRYRGVLVWFNDQRMRAPASYLAWLELQLSAGRRVVVMESIGAYRDLEGTETSTELVNRVIEALGAKDLGGFTDDSSFLAAVHVDPEMIGFERKLPATLDYYQQYRVTEDAKVYLRIERTDRDDSSSDLVWTNPRGGFVAPSYAYSEDRLGDRYVLRWIIDPFLFFERAFAVEGWPRPDFTTLNGQRIFYSQIDGDGLDMITELDYKSKCGKVVHDEILVKYDLPVTASVVVGLTAPRPIGRGSQVDVEVARAIFALDNVEVGSHGLAHPMDWRAGEKSDLSVTGLPDYVLSGESEIAQSVAYINEELAPPGKPCRIMLWTGWCNPSEEQLAVAYRLGLRNLNGGDPRMDSHYPSYAHLVPPVHQVGGLYQYLTSAANDYILTDEWTPPYYRFQNVIQTFERTGAPRRVLPVDVYYHFYIARNPSALTGLRNVLDWAVARPLAPMFTSEYVDVVRDFQWVRLAKRGEATWVARKGPALRTLRFDTADVHVDLDRSAGVIGYLQDRALGVTYVHLDGSAEVRVVTAPAAPARPYVRAASHRVDALRVSGGVITFITGGPTKRTFTFAGVGPGSRHRVASIGQGDEQPLVAHAAADSSGVLQFVLLDRSPGDVRVTVERIE